MVYDVDQLIRKQPDVQCVAHGPGVSRCPVDLVVPEVVPGKRSDGVAPVHAKGLLEGGREATHAIIGLAVGGADAAAVRLDRDDLLIGKLSDGVVIQRRHQQREVVHHVGHGGPPSVVLDRPYQLARCHEREALDGRRRTAGGRPDFLCSPGT